MIVWLTGFVIAGAGMASNLLAILTNGGHMPALRSALRGAGDVRHGHLRTRHRRAVCPNPGGRRAEVAAHLPALSPAASGRTRRSDSLRAT